MAANEEIRRLLFKVAGEIQAEINRLETGVTTQDSRKPMPPQA
jgi:hypothetical protein